MYPVTQLLRPETLPETLAVLAGENTIPLAGGTDVLVKMRHGNMGKAALVSLDKIAALRGIDLTPEGHISIGAMTTFTQLAGDSLIAERLPMLRTAALSMGGPQIQNVATIGGNVCNGATSADSAPSLFALDAILELHSVQGIRQMPITEFYTGPGKVRREKGELLTRIIIPIASKQEWAGVYIKMSTRKAMDISILGSAATCELDAKGVITKGTIALGTAGPTPVRCTEAETLLSGKRLSAALLEELGATALLSAAPRSSWRASAAFREALIRELSARAFLQAYHLAGGKDI